MKLLKPPENDEISDLGWQVIEKALDKESGKRILIDLKHASVSTRKQYYHYLITQGLVGEVPVIASHMGVSGIDTFQNQITQVNNEKANEAKHRDKFNPWAINLCDEDILAITEIGGMIGISLDQRIIGAKNGTFARSVKRRLKKAGLKRNKRYWHSALFLENIFHIVKTSGRPEAWNMICLSSDNDGIIDPIDSCPTAMHLSRFEAILFEIGFKYHNVSEYAGSIFITSQDEMEKQIRKVLHKNLKDFVLRYFPGD